MAPSMALSMAASFDRDPFDYSPLTEYFYSFAIPRARVYGLAGSPARHHASIDVKVYAPRAFNPQLASDATCWIELTTDLSKRSKSRIVGLLTAAEAPLYA